MSLVCKLLGHAYGDGTKEQKEKSEDGKTLVVNYSVQTCSRCGSQKEEKLRTKIRNQTENNMNDVDESNNTQDNTGDTNKESDRQFSTGTASSTATSAIEDQNGGVIIKSKETDNQTEERDVTDREDTEFVEEDGAVLYDEENADGVERVVSCESCDHEKRTTEPSRRDGDMCPSCGGWLDVRRAIDE